MCVMMEKFQMNRPITQASCDVRPVPQAPCLLGTLLAVLVIAALVLVLALTALALTALALTALALTALPLPPAVSQFVPLYPALHEVYVQAPVVPPVAPPLMQ